MVARIDTLDTGVQVTIEHTDDMRATARNLVDIYSRADRAGREWRLLDLIIKRRGRRS